VTSCTIDRLWPPRAQGIQAYFGRRLPRLRLPFAYLMHF
jgi:hypothetical protein